MVVKISSRLLRAAGLLLFLSGCALCVFFDGFAEIPGLWLALLGGWCFGVSFHRDGMYITNEEEEKHGS